MIAKLTGTIDFVGADSIILDVNGIGYAVFVSHDFIHSQSEGQEIELWIHHVVRENNEDLYGFATKNEQNFFELLLGVSGIGPKSALGILNTAPLQTLVDGISSGDIDQLTKVGGIGKKNAEKIILALKDKLADAGTESPQHVGGSDAIDALVALGYKESDARKAVQKIDKNLSTEEIVKEALKSID